MTTLLKILFLPPMLFINLALICFSFHLLYKITKTHKTAKKKLYKIAYASLVSLYITSTPIYVYGLYKIIEVPESRLNLTPRISPQAIVILGAGVKSGALEYGGETLDDTSLERVRAGAMIYRKQPLPILVSGGKFPKEQKATANHMANVLINEFHVPVAYREDQSLTTYENALNTRKILLEGKNIKSIILVTHAYHMHRALDIFEKMGFIVTPAPTLPITISFSGSSFLPHPKMIYPSYLVTHEIIGSLWYKTKPQI